MNYSIEKNIYIQNWKAIESLNYYICIITFHIFIYRRYDDDEKSTWQCGSWCEYIFVVVTSSILLLSAIVMTVFWVIFYRQGYSLEDPAKEFNFHPTLMIAGYITFAGFCKSQTIKHHLLSIFIRIFFFLFHLI